MHLHATGEMESIRYSAARWRAQTSYWGIAEEKKGLFRNFLLGGGAAELRFVPL